MLSRSYSYKEIELSKEQIIALQAKLGDNSDESRHFIDEVRAPLSFYLAHSESIKNNPPPSRPSIKTGLEKLSSILAQLDEILSNKDLEGEYYYILEAQSSIVSLHDSLERETPALTPNCSFEEYYAYSESCEFRAAEDIERMAREARELGKYLQVHLEHFRTNSRGRPRSTDEMHLMKEIATLYKAHFGNFPASHTRGRFHNFIIALMKCAGFHQASWHRSIKPAIDELKSPSQTG